jgi:hypothetical protein
MNCEPTCPHARGPTPEPVLLPESMQAVILYKERYTFRVATARASSGGETESNLFASTTTHMSSLLRHLILSPLSLVGNNGVMVFGSPFSASTSLTLSSLLVFILAVSLLFLFLLFLLLFLLLLLLLLPRSRTLSLHLL